MAIAQYLAMTAAEMAGASPLPPRAAWMACHFSPYSTGLTNLPQRMPKDSLLILNDRTPIHGHDPQRVCAELKMALARFGCSGLLVDFQNAGSKEASALTQYLAKNLDCPIALTPEYRTEGAAVFLPPVPTDTRLTDYLAPWAGQAVWLDTTLEGQTITLSEKGAAYAQNLHPDELPCQEDQALHCHYSIRLEKNAAVFHTWRTREDLAALLKEADGWGVHVSVGLYQEFGTWVPKI